MAVILAPGHVNAIGTVVVAGAVVGTAFVVAPGYAITAKHVVDGVLVVIEVRFRSQVACTATVIPSRGADWVLLELTPSPPLDPIPLALFDRWHPEWVTQGSGGMYAGQGPIRGDFYSASPTEIGLRCPQLATVEQAKGYSGAPIITSAGAVGVMSYVRGPNNGPAAAGFMAAVTTRAVLETWPDEKLTIRPKRTLAPYVTVLRATIQPLVHQNTALREKLMKAVRLADVDPAMVTERIAERLVELDWPEVITLVDELGTFAPNNLVDLLCSMWVGRDAARRFGEIHDANKLPIIQTKAPVAVRHHVMRAQAERTIDSLINWADRRRHLFYASLDSGESLLAVIENALAGHLAYTPDEVKDLIDVVDPVFVTVNSVPSAEEVKAVRDKFGSNLRLIGYAELISKQMLDGNASAEQVKPDPDPTREKTAKVLSPKEFT